VTYRRGGALKTARVNARREVILSAGAVNSPQLLLLSGVGAGAALRAKGLEVRGGAARKPLARNLQDHLGRGLSLSLPKLPTLNEQLNPWWGKLLAGMRYVTTRGGPLGLSVNQGGGFVRGRPDRTRPNLQLYFSPVSYIKAPPRTRPLLNPDPYPGFLLGYSACRPTSRGEIMIRSADPFEAPAIRPAYLSTNHDIEEMVEGSRLMRRLAATPALSAIIDEELQPGEAVASDADFADDARKRAGTVFHPCGTCIMGPDPATSVVDPRLRVHGLSGLRVIDASIFPNVTSGNTNAPAIMVGEKGADLVLEDAPGR
jgi:choline dehydrogenase